MVALLSYAKAQLHGAKAARDVAIFLLLGYGRALRQNEVVQLDFEDFDARGGRVNVLRKGKRIKPGPIDANGRKRPTGATQRCAPSWRTRTLWPAAMMRRQRASSA
jgi:site-specific recombinase XerC